MTHTDTQQSIIEIMESLDVNVEYDQLINKLVDKNIITSDEVTRINILENQEKLQELLVVLLNKDQEMHPLVLEILNGLKTPNPENTRKTDQAIAQAVSGAGQLRRKGDRRILSSSDVSQDWELKNFLFEISRDISKDELEDMKFIMSSESGFKSRAIDKIERPMKFFQQMMNTGKLNPYNLHFLQALVRRIGRKDLNDKVREFCLESNKKPIHFFTPSEQPENGYKYVKHHIEGDIDSFTHMQKERLRSEVAVLLCIPPTFVFIKGIEPTSSILITFMVPAEDVQSFIQIYYREGPSFFQFSIHIGIDGDEMELSDIPPKKNTNPEPMTRHLQDLLEREKRLQEQLDDRDERLLELQEQLESKEENTVDQYLPEEHDDEMLEEEHSKKAEFYKTLANRMMHAMESMQPRECKNGTSRTETLKLSSASALYKKILQQVTRSGVDTNILNKLLDTRALIENSIREDSFKRMREIIHILSQKVEELTEMNGFLRMSASITGGSSSFLQDILSIQTERSKHAIEQQKEQHGLEINDIIGVHVVQRIPVSLIDLRDEDKTKLATITQELTQKEKNRLKTFLCFSEKEKETLKDDPNRLLELAVLREYRTGRQEPIVILLREILLKIKKETLVHKLSENKPLPEPKLGPRRSLEKKRRSETPRRKENEAPGH